VACGCFKGIGTEGILTSFRHLEEGIRTLKDVSEAPILRARIEELEEELVKKDKECAGKIQKLQEKNANLVSTINSLRAENKNLNNLKIEFKKEKLDLRGIDRVVRSRMDETIQKNIEKKAQKLCNKRLPFLIEVEIKKYPHSCSEATRIAIEKKATQLSNETLRRARAQCAGKSRD